MTTLHPAAVAIRAAVSFVAMPPVPHSVPDVLVSTSANAPMSHTSGMRRAWGWETRGRLCARSSPSPSPSLSVLVWYHDNTITLTLTLHLWSAGVTTRHAPCVTSECNHAPHLRVLVGYHNMMPLTLHPWCVCVTS